MLKVYRKKLKIRAKILITLLPITLLIVISLLTWILLVVRNNAIQHAVDLAETKAEKLAEKVHSDIDIAMEAVTTLAEIQKTGIVNQTLTRKAALDMAQVVNRQSPLYLSVWLSYEPNVVEAEDENFINTQVGNETGRFLSGYYRDKDELLLQIVDNEEVTTAEYHQLPKQEKRPLILDPYWYSYTASKHDEILMTSVLAPLIIDDEFKAVIGLDIGMTELQKENEKVKLYESGFGRLITRKGVIVAGHPTDSLGSSYARLANSTSPELEAVKKGNRYINFSKGAKIDTLRIYLPINFSRIQDKWIYEVSIPYEEIIAETNALMQRIIFAAIIGFAILISIVFWIAHDLSSPLRILLANANEIADGKLSSKVTISGEDEIGRLAEAFELMRSRLRNLIIAIQENAEHLSAGAEQVSNGAQEISKGANTQAASTEEISASIEEILTSVETNAENASRTSEKSAESANAIFETGKMADEAEKSLKIIVEKIRQVEEIASKTDMLAINAAIEAARAGQLGKGFSVVAHEVRKLAESSQMIAQAIRDGIMKTAEDSQKVVSFLEKTRPVVEMAELLNKEISNTSNEQRVSTQQISLALQEFSQIVQGNSSTAEELAASAEELVQQGNGLLEQIRAFKL